MLTRFPLEKIDLSYFSKLPIPTSMPSFFLGKKSSPEERFEEAKLAVLILFLPAGLIIHNSLSVQRASNSAQSISLPSNPIGNAYLPNMAVLQLKFLEFVVDLNVPIPPLIPEAHLSLKWYPILGAIPKLKPKEFLKEFEPKLF